MAGTDGDRTAFRRRLGLSLAAFRRAAGYTQQQQVADELGINVETLGRYERGTKEPKAYDVHRMAQLYGVDSDWLLNPTDSTTERDARAAMLRRAAAELAQDEVAEELAQLNGGGTSSQRDKSQP